MAPLIDARCTRPTSPVRPPCGGAREDGCSRKRDRQRPRHRGRRRLCPSLPRISSILAPAAWLQRFRNARKFQGRGRLDFKLVSGFGPYPASLQATFNLTTVLTGNNVHPVTVANPETGAAQPRLRPLGAAQSAGDGDAGLAVPSRHPSADPARRRAPGAGPMVRRRDVDSAFPSDAADPDLAQQSDLQRFGDRDPVRQRRSGDGPQAVEVGHQADRALHARFRSGQLGLRFHDVLCDARLFSCRRGFVSDRLVRRVDMVTQTLVVFCIRTRRLFFRRKPGGFLAVMAKGAIATPQSARTFRPGAYCLSIQAAATVSCVEYRQRMPIRYRGPPSGCCTSPIHLRPSRNISLPLPS